jgi:hypothetical protein
VNNTENREKCEERERETEREREGGRERERERLMFVGLVARERERERWVVGNMTNEYCGLPNVQQSSKSYPSRTTLSTLHHEKTSGVLQHSSYLLCILQ